ncbi:MAG: CRISPR-associated helicase Cas3' [Polyangiales bacterium]
MENAFWGKLHRDGEDGPFTAWHPLEDHCADVAACTEALLTQTLLGRRLARLGGLEVLDDVQVARLCVLAALHDLGKFNQGFQNKGQKGVLPHAGHVSEALAALFSFSDVAFSDQLHAAIGLDDIDSWGTALSMRHLIRAAICRHGRPMSESEQGFSGAFWGGAARMTAIEKFMGKVRQWFPKAYAEGGAPLPAGAEFQHGFSGLVMLADWLGSNPHPDFFRYTEETDVRPRIEWARERARLLLTKMVLDVEDARAALGGDPVGYERVMKHSPLGAQPIVRDLPTRCSRGTLTILEAETGSGKTEAALMRYLRMFQAGDVDGMYLALPTRTAATQIHERVRRVMEEFAFPNAPPEVRPPVVLAVPGYLQVDDAPGKALPHFRVQWNDDDPRGLRFRGWAAESPKRYLAGAVVVGTIDQVLLSALRVSHMHLRATALLRQLLVVDEVHASDTYMSRILEEVLGWHVGAGGHALLMSATLGAWMREILIEKTARPRRAYRFDDVPSVEVTRAVPYPLVTQLEGSERRPSIPIVAEGQPKTVTRKLCSIIDSPEEVARIALDAAAGGARVLVVRNTVKACIATQRCLERLAGERGLTHLLFGVGGHAAPHHARFARADRTLLDDALEARFGKDSKTAHCVVVATQTVQQALDLDADLLLTDLCPMDVLLQRIGRLHRHKTDRVRAGAYATPLVVVLTPASRDLSVYLDGSKGERPKDRHGFGSVYGDLRVIEATWRGLEANETLVIPTMNRALVEDATHPQVLEAMAAAMGGPWAKHRLDRDGVFYAHRGLAAAAVLTRSVAFGATVWRATDVEEMIKTRLGEGDRVARFEDGPQGPFGKRVWQLNVPHWMAKGVDAEAAPTGVSVSGGVLRFSFGDDGYVYDRIGLRRASDEEDGDGDV